MGYIDQNLLPDERIHCRTKKHLILFFYPVVLTILSVFATAYMQDNPLLTKLVLAPWVVTGLLWAHVLLDYLSSDYAVTDRRVMMREGFFIRHANEMRLSTISQVNIDQSLIGQILGYGTVSIHGFGAVDSYPLIARPYEFQRSVQLQMDQQK